MTIEEALTAYVLSCSAITDKIVDRFEFDVQTRKGYPAIIAQCISDIPTNTHEGQTNLRSPNYQFTALALSRSAARALADEINSAFCDYSGMMSGVEINSITLLNDLPNTLTSPDGIIKVHAVDLEYQINYYKG